MAEITLAPATRIRVITRALELLTEFNAQVHSQLASGEIKMTPAIKTMSRNNAEAEGKLRRKLRKLHKDVVAGSGRDPVQDKDLVMYGFSEGLREKLSHYDIHTKEAPFPAPGQILIKRVDHGMMKLDLIISSEEDGEIEAQSLTTAVFDIEIEEQ